MEVQRKLFALYDCLVKTSLDKSGNLVMPWNQTDTAAEWAWMGLLRLTVDELEAYLSTTSSPLDHFVISRAIDQKRRQAK